MARLQTFIPRLLNIDIAYGCLFRVLVLITPARTTGPVKRVLPTKATAVCVLLDSRVRNVKMVRGAGNLMRTGSLSKMHGNGDENLDKQNV